MNNDCLFSSDGHFVHMSKQSSSIGLSRIDLEGGWLPN